MEEVISLEERLERKGVKPTSNRILVLKELLVQEQPVSLSELEQIMETLDKSSIFRTMTLFHEHHVVHAFEDGNGIIKYELCRNVDECRVDDMHIHFYCVRCHKTYCMPSTPIPQIRLPEGFLMQSVNYMVKGICARCSSKD